MFCVPACLLVCLLSEWLPKGSSSRCLGPCTAGLPADCGCSHAQAVAATDATGCDIELGLQLLLEVRDSWSTAVQEDWEGAGQV